VSKLLELKKWLTVPAAAERLSTILEDKVTEADVFRLALDGHLTLSAYFGQPDLVRGSRAVALDSLQGYILALSKEHRASIDPDGPLAWLREEKEIQSEFIFGVRDFVITKRDTLAFIEQQYLRQSGTTWDHVACWCGIAISGGDGAKDDFCLLEECAADNGLFREMEPSGIILHFTVANELPKGTMFVIRTEALRDFEQRLADREEQAEQEPVEDADKKMAAMFDPVRFDDLERLFPTGHWKAWTNNAKRYPALHIARTAPAQWNPYLAAQFLKKKVPNWTEEMINAALKKALPERSEKMGWMLDP
jgi:hypothetical protein